MKFLTRLLSTDEAEDLRRAVAEAPFADGRTSAGALAARSKQNRELAEPMVQQRIESLVHARLRSSAFFVHALCGSRISPVLVNAYGTGDAYGEHVDAPLQRIGDTLFRSDFSFTVFLSPPESYGGGELLVEGAQLKGQQGEVVVYPSASLHQVKEVTHGTRIAAVGWIQSALQSPERVRVVSALDEARRALAAGAAPPQLDRAEKLLAVAHASLLQMWATIG